MIKLVNTGFGFVIGERINSTDKELLTLKSPANMVIGVDNQTGVVSFKVLEFPWKPTVITLPSNYVSFDVTDETVLRLYKQVVTGITLVNSGEILRTH